MIWVLLPIILQIICVIHLFKGRANRLWLLAIIALPIIGCLAYSVLEILPELQGNKHVRKVRKQAVRTINPDGAIRDARERLALTDSSANRLALADALAEANRAEEAVPAYRSAMEAMPFADSTTQCKLVDVLLQSNQAAQAQAFLADMEAPSTDSERTLRYLLQGRAAEAMKDEDQARQAFARALAVRGNDEARCRLAALHIAAGEAYLALGLLRDVKQNYDLRDKALIDSEQGMYDWALTELARLERAQ